MTSGSQLSASKRPKWLHISMGVALILVTVALWVFWQILGAEAARISSGSTVRWVVYFFGTVLFLLLLGGLGLMIILLVREVRLNERQSNFVSAVTHELKTPVASLRLYLDTLELREVPDLRRREFYRTMREDLDRLNTTINNVLHAAMYTDRPVTEPTPVDLARLVRRAVELTRTRHQLGKDTVNLSAPDSLLVLGDATALETAVLNLLDNAVKYSREKVKIEVDLALTVEGEARLRVKDHGVGMSRAHLRLVFNRFYRIGSEVRRSRTGTGLGLFIVKSVVKGHKGRITGESPGLDKGATFTVILPGVVSSEQTQGSLALHG